MVKFPLNMRYSVCLPNPCGFDDGASGRRGMTRVELLLVYVVLALAAVLLAGVNRYVQREAKCRLAEDMLLTLRESLPAYHEAVGRYPAEQEDHDAKRAIASLLSESASGVRQSAAPGPMWSSRRRLGCCLTVSTAWRWSSGRPGCR